MFKKVDIYGSVFVKSFCCCICGFWLVYILRVKFSDCYIDKFGIVRCFIDYSLKYVVGVSSRIGIVEVKEFVCKYCRW